MPTELTGAAIWRATITAPASGDARSAASVATMGQDLADSIAYLNAQDATNQAFLQAQIDAVEQVTSDVYTFMSGSVRPAIEVDSYLETGDEVTPAATVSAGGSATLKVWTPSNLLGTRIQGDVYLVTGNVVAVYGSVPGDIGSIKDTYIDIENNVGMSAFAYFGMRISTGANVSFSKPHRYTGSTTPSAPTFTVKVYNGSATVALKIVSWGINVTRWNQIEFTP